MITALVPGILVPAWDRELMQSVNDLTFGLAEDHTTTWPFGVMNDDGKIYRRIVAESAAECAILVEHFSMLQFKLVEVGGKPVMRRMPFSSP